MQLLFQPQVDEAYGKLQKFLETKQSLNYSKWEANKTSKSTKSAFWLKVAERPDMWEDAFCFLFFFSILYCKELTIKGKAMLDLYIVHSVLPSNIHRRHCFSKVICLCSSILATEKNPVVLPMLGKMHFTLFSLWKICCGKMAL